MYQYLLSVVGANMPSRAHLTHEGTSNTCIDEESWRKKKREKLYINSVICLITGTVLNA